MPIDSFDILNPFSIFIRAVSSCDLVLLISLVNVPNLSVSNRLSTNNVHPKASSIIGLITSSFLCFVSKTTFLFS